MKIAVVGGTGVYDLSWLQSQQELQVDTPYGAVAVVCGQLAEQGRDVYFLNRHGNGHQLPPHHVNYRANVWALAQLGVKRILATAAVGSMTIALPPGHLVLCDQFLDFTKLRSNTFFDGGQRGVVHTDMTDPYCPQMRAIIHQCAQAIEFPAVNGGCYVATEGPRFETPAEIRAFRMLGGDVVGMTGVPEVVLARELGLCYSAVALVTNYAAGITTNSLTHEEVLDLMEQHKTALNQLIQASIPLMQEYRECSCLGSEHMSSE